MTQNGEAIQESTLVDQEQLRSAKPQGSPEEVNVRLQLLELDEKKLALGLKQLELEKSNHEMHRIEGLRLMEVGKVWCDFYKHVATLSTGAILIFLTMSSKVIENARYSKTILLAVVVPFLIAIATALIAHNLLPFYFVKSEGPFNKKVYAYCATCCIGAFLIGLVAIVGAFLFAG